MWKTVWVLENPSLDFWVGLSDWVKVWGNLVATVVVASATVWYAILTHRLAKSAKLSADSAKDAATQAAVSANAAQKSADLSREVVELTKAGMPVEFDVQLLWLFGGFPIPVLVLQCRRARVFVHSVRVAIVEVRGADGSAWWAKGDEFDVRPQNSLPFAISAAVPLSMHLVPRNPATWNHDDLSATIDLVNLEVQFSYLMEDPRETTFVLGRSSPL